jgi:hypothetical protein
MIRESAESMPSAPIWYVSYGSNMCRARFDCYLRGGRPAGAARTYPGCRDTTPPREVVTVDLPGTVYFAGESVVWGGGVAGYDHATPGPSKGRAYLITAQQFADIAAQEMSRAPGEGPDLTEVLLAKESVRGGVGRYETLCWLGERAGVPMLTFTGPWRVDEVAHAAPSPAYLRMLREGLTEMGLDERWLPAHAGDRAGRV